MINQPVEAVDSLDLKEDEQRCLKYVSGELSYPNFLSGSSLTFKSSQPVMIEGRAFNMNLYPKGEGIGENKYISVYLAM